MSDLINRSALMDSLSFCDCIESMGYNACIDEILRRKNEAINELQANIDLPFGFTVSDETSEIAIKALEEIPEYRAYKEIFESHFSKEALEFLSDKEEFGKWLERGKWIAKRCDEIARELEQYRAIGTVEEFKVLKEKCVAKKIDWEGGAEE